MPGIGKPFKEGRIPWNKGKTYEELYGKKKAKEMRDFSSKINTGRVSTQRIADGVASFNSLLRMYRNSAKKRNIEWSLTIDEFRLLTQGNCVYCNELPLQTTSGEKYNGSYIYNGIDRVDNNSGYIFDNCVSCCKKCNIAKWEMSVTEFKEWLLKVYNFLIGE